MSEVKEEGATKGQDVFSGTVSVKGLLLRGDTEVARVYTELFLRTCVGSSGTDSGKWNLNGCTFKIEDGFILIGGISTKQSNGKGGSIIVLCLSYGLDVYADCCTVRGMDIKLPGDTFSVRVPVVFFDEIVSCSVFTVLEGEPVVGREVVCKEGTAGEVSGRVASVLGGEWEEGCREVGINPDFDPGFIF